MLCDVCKQAEARVHLTQILEGKKQKMDLCEACSKQKGVDDPTGVNLADLLLGLGAAQEMDQTAGELRCPHCGFTQADFKKAGRLGCSHCYDTFAEPLEGLLKTMHKDTRHVGKTPRGKREAQDHLERLKSLQSQLDTAIKAEDFEQAASLRDEIKTVKTRLFA